MDYEGQINVTSSDFGSKVIYCSDEFFADSCRMLQNNELTDFSTTEQKSAGLNDCNDSEIQLFEELNHQYFVKFNFPFIMAVKEKDKLEILSSFKSRQKNTVSQERLNALSEINKIAWLRIKEIYGL